MLMPRSTAQEHIRRSAANARFANTGEPSIDDRVKQGVHVGAADVRE